MALAKTYLTVNGKIRSEQRSGEAHSRDYVLDPLGSVIQIYQNGWPIADACYEPYGGIYTQWNMEGKTFTWLGGWGYRQTGVEWSSVYVRARHYSRGLSNWTSIDPLWPSEMAYGYVEGRVMTASDPSGKRPCTLYEEANCFSLCGSKGLRYTGTCTAKDIWIQVFSMRLGRLVDLDCGVCEPLLRNCKCSAERLAALSSQIALSCWMRRSCSSFFAQPPDNKRCLSIYANIGLSLSCIYAQEALNKECFAGGDPGHKQKVEEAQRAINTCSRAAAFNGCAPYWQWKK